MWTVRKQRDHLIIFVDYSHMNSDGENHRMFNEPSGMFLLIQMLLRPVLEQLSLWPRTGLICVCLLSPMTLSVDRLPES